MSDIWTDRDAGHTRKELRKWHTHECGHRQTYRDADRKAYVERRGMLLGARAKVGAEVVQLGNKLVE